jgi:lipopolysaccharide export system permease protein
MIIDKYLVKHFFPVFFVAMAMFVTLVVLIDLFVNLVNYLNYNATFTQILTVSYYYVPKSVEYAIPISLLFAVAYSLGELYARNELTSIISSGIPFWRLSSSLLMIGLFMSAFSFFFSDKIVIPTLKVKNEMSRELKHQQNSDTDANVVIKVNDGKLVYAVDLYDYENKTLNGVQIIETDDNWEPVSIIRSQVAHWSDDHWEFSNAIIYKWANDEKNPGGRILKPFNFPPSTDYRDDPELFRRAAVDPDDLNASDAKYFIEDLKRVGLPYREAETDYFHRFSFPFTAFIVIILSLSVAGRFRKNILLMSLLVSLGISVVYYVMEMVTMLMANSGTIPPIAGGWAPVIFFTFLGVVLLRFSKT